MNALTPRSLKSIAPVLLVAGWLSCPATAQTVIHLRSGNGHIDTQDSKVSFLLGPLETNFDHTFNSADFAAAKSGLGAFIIAPDQAWLGSLPSVPDAKWIATDFPGGQNYGASALFAVSFEVPSVTLVDATLDVWFAVDNWLGGASNDGLFLNGVGIPGSVYNEQGAHLQEHAFLNLGVTALLHPGTNTLYLYEYDFGLVAGLIFGAKLTLLTEPWVDLGGAMAGQAGSPVLAGAGSLSTGSTVQLSLTAAKPFALSTLVVGLGTVNAPFKGGVMVPNLDLTFTLTTDFFGKSSFGGLWPSGIPSGFTAYFQWWIQDPAGPKGFAASNALAATTP